MASRRRADEPRGSGSEAGPRSVGRGRLVVFAVTALVCITALVAYLLVQHGRTAADASGPGDGLSVQDVQAVPHVVVRDTRPASRDDIALIPLSDPDGPRAVVPVKCLRVAATRTRTLCLQQQNSAVGPVYRAVYLGGAFQQIGTQSLPGVPSRARLSSGGSWAAWTAFTSGHSYSDSGFATQTEITRVDGMTSLGNLETWTTTRNGTPVTTQDRNYWGVTFIGDGPRFYATMATGAVRYLVEGDASSRTMTVVAANGACPSVSDDGSTVVMKEQDAISQQDHFVAFEPATGRRTALRETHIVDDQVTWDAPDTVLYAISNGLAKDGDLDIWSSPVDGGIPHVLIHHAASPSVIRAGA